MVLVFTSSIDNMVVLGDILSAHFIIPYQKWYKIMKQVLPLVVLI